MIRRSHSLMMILAIAGCSAPQTHAANTDTVALLRTVVRYASDTLKVGPRIIIARSTKVNPDARLSLPTQQALLADSLLSAVERYDLAHQTCDPAAKPPVCHFQTADGMIAVRNVRVWRDSAQVGIEYYRTNNVAAADAKAAPKRTLVFNAGDVSLDRDVEGHWKIRHFTETGGGTKP